MKVYIIAKREDGQERLFSVNAVSCKHALDKANIHLLQHHKEWWVDANQRDCISSYTEAGSFDKYFKPIEFYNRTRKDFPLVRVKA